MHKTCQCTKNGRDCKNEATILGGYVKAPIWIGYVCKEHFVLMSKVGFKIFKSPTGG